jgi:hypothetical protein
VVDDVVSQISSDEMVERYLDPWTTGRVELLVLRFRLSALVWLACAQAGAFEERRVELAEMRADGSYLVDGWETESEQLFDEEVGAMDDAVSLATASTVAAVGAALELFMKDLLCPPDAQQRPNATGIWKVFNRILAGAAVNPDDEARLRTLLATIAQRRNLAAHVSIGSLWDREPRTWDFDVLEAMLSEVGEFATLLVQSLEHSRLDAA